LLKLCLLLKNYSMNTSLQKLFNEIELQRNKTIDSIRHLSEAELSRSLTPGKWSISQILSHLITAERMSLHYIQKKIQGVEQTRDSGLWEEIKIILLAISQRLPALKFKAPQRVIESTTIYGDLNRITQEWELVRNELCALLEKIPDDYINRKIYRHVRAGYLNVRHALIFFREHVTHHTPQIKNLRNKFE
jgi:uncharacterized damage-inducible protein DinB